MFSNFDTPIVATSKRYPFQARSEKLIFGKISKGYYVPRSIYTRSNHFRPNFVRFGAAGRDVIRLGKAVASETYTGLGLEARPL